MKSQKWPTKKGFESLLFARIREPLVFVLSGGIESAILSGVHGRDCLVEIEVQVFNPRRHSPFCHFRRHKGGLVRPLNALRDSHISVVKLR